MIDTHCHLTDPRLQSQLDGVLARAAAAGVAQMVTVGTSVADSEQCVALCRRYPDLRCAIGIHPHHAAEADLGAVSHLRELQADPSVIALGEMGLDYHYDFAPRQRQAQVLQAQLEIAVELGRPVVIHCREAVDDCLAILGGFPTMHAVFHCFTGSPSEADRILDAGYLLGFTGVVTFKNSAELREVVRRTPMDRLLLETDAPYLSPEPLRRQKVNEPSLLVHTAQAIASLKEIALGELDQVTTANASRFFGGWPIPAC